MADVTVGPGEVSSGRLTLAANTVITVAFTDNIGAVQITTDGTAPVYYTVDGRTPTVDSRIAYEIPAAGVGIATNETANTPGNGDIIKLISAGTPTVRVERA